MLYCLFGLIILDTGSKAKVSLPNSLLACNKGPILDHTYTQYDHDACHEYLLIDRLYHSDINV